jgi:tetratricopeptide (TPR) repeat protein
MNSAASPSPCRATDFLRSGALAVAGTPGANQRCWYAALANAGLDQALSDCDAAVASAPRQYAFLDSRALARLRRGELDQALADYDAAIDLFAKDPWTLYCRGVTRIRKGMTAKGRADIAAAVAIDASVPARARAIGITP